MNGARLRKVEVESGIDTARAFSVSRGDVCVLVTLERMVEEPWAGSLAEEERPPHDHECLEVLERLVRMCEEADAAAGWEEYRRHLLETQAGEIPAWEDLPGEVQEAFAAGMRKGGGR